MASHSSAKIVTTGSWVPVIVTLPSPRRPPGDLPGTTSVTPDIAPAGSPMPGCRCPVRPTWAFTPEQGAPDHPEPGDLPRRPRTGPWVGRGRAVPTIHAWSGDRG